MSFRSVCPVFTVRSRQTDDLTVRYVPSWFPGGYFNAQAKQWNEHFRGTREIAFAVLKRDMVRSPGSPSTIAYMRSREQERRNPVLAWPCWRRMLL